MIYVILVILGITKIDSTIELEDGNVIKAVSKNAPCDSPIYCIGGPGTILHTIQMARLYNDSKTFVDKPLIHSENQTLKNFEIFMKVLSSIL